MFKYLRSCHIEQAKKASWQKDFLDFEILKALMKLMFTVKLQEGAIFTFLTTEHIIRG